MSQSQVPVDDSNISVNSTSARRLGVQSCLWAVALPLIGYALSAGLLALAQSGEQPISAIWDDALFFRRVSHNILTHGVAGWNVSEGPVFINTSQLHQVVSTLLLAVFPAVHNAALYFWSALCLTLAAILNVAAHGRHHAGALLAVVAFSAPMIQLTVVTGMETASVLLVTSAVTAALLGPWRWARTPWALGGLQLLTYLAHPDAILLSCLLSAAVLLGRGEVRALLKLGLVTATLLAAATACFQLTYGTPVPLSTFLKISPLSVYDADYLGLGDSSKWANLRLVALTSAPLVALSLLRRDRTQAALAFAALCFVAFHGFTTNEIMGYHARFYAPCFPLLIAMALRASSSVASRRALAWVGLALLAIAGLARLAYRQGWVENATRGLETVPATHYVAYFAGFLAVAVVLAAPRRFASWMTMGSPLLLLPLWVAPLNLAHPRLRPDAENDLGLVRASSALVGAERIKRCFEEPLTFTHSELGALGVFFLHSRVIDYTGLANPEVAAGTFDFERLCREQRPEFLFRPHWTHQRLNRAIDQSTCLKSDYVLVEPNSSAALYVRADLVDRYRTCDR